MSGDTVAAALDYRRRRWVPIVVPARSKAPLGNGWQRQRLEDDEIRQAFANGANVGVLLGDASGGLVDVDLDSAEARRLAGAFLPATPLIFGRAGAPRSHWLCTSRGCESRRFRDPAASEDRAVLVELRAAGRNGRTLQTVFPGSVHPSGEAIAWDDTDGEDEPTEVGRYQLHRAVAKLAAAALLARHLRRPGQRHDASLALAGGLLRSGWTVERVVEFVRVVAVAADHEDVDDRVQGVHDTAAELVGGVGKPRLRAGRG